MLKTLLQAGLLLLFTSPAVIADDISGTWTLRMKGFNGDEEFDMIIQASGEKLKATANHPMFGAMKGNGRLKGNSIKFKLNSEEIPMTIEFTGTVTEKKMSGIRVIQSGEGPGDFGGPGGFGGPEPGRPNDMDTRMSKISKEWKAEKQ